MGIAEKICLHGSHLKSCRHNQVAFKLVCLDSQLTIKFLKSISSIDFATLVTALCARLFRHNKETVKGKCPVLSGETASPAADKRVKNWVQGLMLLG